MDNEITEIAKAAQEVAKTTRTGIEAAQGFGGFLARVFGEPVETAVGMLADKLRFVREDRRMRLANRYSQIMSQRGIRSEDQPVLPKMAVPVIENASLEENDELQDIWANLLASAHDTSMNGILRFAFIDIIKQLEVVDVHVLNHVYSAVLNKNIEHGKYWTEKYKRDVRLDPIRYGVPDHDIKQSLELSQHDYECAVDNLLRVRCLSHYMENIEIPDKYPAVASLVHEYEWVSITPLGWNFVRSCTLTF